MIIFYYYVLIMWPVTNTILLKILYLVIACCDYPTATRLLSVHAFLLVLRDHFGWLLCRDVPHPYHPDSGDMAVCVDCQSKRVLSVSQPPRQGRWAGEEKMIFLSSRQSLSALLMWKSWKTKTMTKWESLILPHPAEGSGHAYSLPRTSARRTVSSSTRSASDYWGSEIG